MISPACQNADAGSAAAPRLGFIDGLRGMAMLMVVLFHCAAYSDGWHASGLLSAMVGYGRIGVNLFLVLSGFCLYWPFVKTGTRREPTLWEFAQKRGRRILPAYYAALMVFWLFLLWDVLSGHHVHSDATGLAHVWRSLGWHAVMLHNLRPEYVLSINGPFWSLALESSLYVLFPLLVEAFRRFGPARPLLVLLALSLTYRWAVFTLCPPAVLTGEEQFVLFDSLPGRCFEFGAGMLAAWLLARPAISPRGELPWRVDAVCLAGGLSAVLLTASGGVYSPAVDALWGVCFAALIIAVGHVGRRVHRLFAHPILVRLGLCSYSVYLIHQPLVKAMDGVVMRHHWPAAAAGLFVITPAVVLLGYGFHLLFERPFLGPPRPKTARPPAREPVLAPLGEQTAL